MVDDPDDPDDSGEESVTTPSVDDEGKTVVDASGDDVGVVVEVERETVYVDPDPATVDRFRSVLGWSDVDEEQARPIRAERIARITDERIELVDEAEMGEDR